MLVGISIVRNEADIVELSVRHHLAQGVDLLLICDDDSSDGTGNLLRQIGYSNSRVRWTANKTNGFYQADALNALVDDARRLGASWILAFDADEFWYSRDGLANAVGQAPHEPLALEVEVMNFTSPRDQIRLEAAAATRARYRVRQPIGAASEARELVEAGSISYIEMRYPQKFIFSAKSGLAVTAGAHDVIGEVRKRPQTSILCLHVPLRAKEVLRSKIDHARRLKVADFPEDHGWHLHYFARQAELGQLDSEWAANSQKDESIDAKRGKVSLMHDPLLSNLIRPFVGDLASVIL